MIINSTIQSISGIYANQGTAATSRARAKAAATAPNDEVLLSSRAKSLSSALGHLRDMDDVRPEKVAYFAGLVSSGAYDVPAENIAASMMGMRY